MKKIYFHRQLFLQKKLFHQQIKLIMILLRYLSAIVLLKANVLKLKLAALQAEKIILMNSICKNQI